MNGYIMEYPPSTIKHLRHEHQSTHCCVDSLLILILPHRLGTAHPHQLRKLLHGIALAALLLLQLLHLFWRETSCEYLGEGDHDYEEYDHHDDHGVACYQPHQRDMRLLLEVHRLQHRSYDKRIGGGNSLRTGILVLHHTHRPILSRHLKLHLREELGNGPH